MTFGVNQRADGLRMDAHCQMLAWVVQTGLHYLRLPVRESKSGADGGNMPTGHALVIEGKNLFDSCAADSTTKNVKSGMPAPGEHLERLS